MKAEIVIRGGGLAGMTLALALARTGRACLIQERRRRDEVCRDGRILALSHASAAYLARLGVWQRLPATPISRVHVSQQGSCGRLVLEAEDAGAPVLGYVVAAGDLAVSLSAAIDAHGIGYQDEATADPPLAALCVHAEGSSGAGADSRHRDYHQLAIVCRLRPLLPHRGQAWERFTPAGPLALLPHGEDYAAILVVDEREAPALLALSDAAFLEHIVARLGCRLFFSSCGERRTYPLRLVWRERLFAEREVWIGNAAQTLHPVGGQGFNLALRDIAELEETLIDAADPGDPALLARYAAKRRLDRRATVAFTDLLAHVFLGDVAVLSPLRGAGLVALDLIQPLRAFLARRLIYGARAW